ncbi:MAG: tRNA (adenosine(37)-N6)-threonylcarbamoyltransferase complex ATPase subunit type 1 TsaE [candidate division Zixibacteria bacterium]|nr:tRNA (adenosine(37)-N6)-threonylcarbamoyltransferase complex ATPase subunit type 1 TsaE [candidate division Zixibacteria bacterium]
MSANQVVECPSEEDTFQLGKRVGRSLLVKTFIAVNGELGMGKTVLCRGIVAGIGLHPDIVSSPTFTIVNEYPGSPGVLHFDFYRVNKSIELFQIGWDEYLERPEVILVEWAEKFESILPEKRIDVSINEKGDNRTIIIQNLN